MIRRTIPALSVFAFVFLSCATASPRVEEQEASYLQTQDGALLHYRKIGDGPEVLLVPADNWMGQDLDGLARGRTVIFYDLRGRGRSDRTFAARFEQDLEDLQYVADWFQLERFSLLGFDYQAALSAHYAALHPQRVERLVLVSPIPPRKFPYWAIYERVWSERRGGEVEKLREMKRSGLPRKDPEAWAEAYVNAMLSGWVAEASALRRMKSRPVVPPNMDPERLVRQYLGMLRDLGEWDWRDIATLVACPTLVIAGERDPMPSDTFQEWASKIPEGRLRLIGGSGRLPWIEDSKTFYESVERFLDGDGV